MPITIQLASGRSVLIDELTGDPIGDGNPLDYDPTDPGETGDDPGGSVDFIRNEIATKAGYSSWDDYVRAVGENRALSLQQTALQIQKLQGEIARAGGAAGVSPTVAAQLAQAREQFTIGLEQDRTELAEKQRQFNETFGADKARFNIQQTEATRQFNDRLGFDGKQLDVERGKALLSLGSRPDTLIRYLYALRGQQAPQGLGTPPALPGFPNVAAAPGSAAPAAPSIAAPAQLGTATVGQAQVAPSSAPTLVPTLTGGTAQITNAPAGGTYLGADASGTALYRMPDGSIRKVAGGVGGYQAPSSGAVAAGGGGTPTAATIAGVPRVQERPAPPITAVNPANLSPILQPVAQSVQFAPSGTQLGNRVDDENDALNQIRSREQYNAYQRSIGGKEAAPLKYDPSVGRLYKNGGLISEPVVGVGLISGQRYSFGEAGPEHVVPEGKSLKDVKGKRPKRTGSYQTGGMIGYQPIDPKVFNPTRISNEFSFPQIGNLTGGTSLIPSAQRLFGALPSERSLYSGYIRDEVGGQPDDVYEIARRLAPQVMGLRAGRFTN